MAPPSQELEPPANPARFIYFFFASIVNSVYIVSLAATVQIYQPQLRAAYKQGGIASLHRAIRPRLRSTVAISIFALGATGPALWLLVSFIEKSELRSAFIVTPILLFALGIKVNSDFFSALLVVTNNDLKYAIYNIINLSILSLLYIFFIPFMGIIGAAAALLLTTVMSFLLRIYDFRTHRPQP
jgi:O-antigen/teichoic acid export membrane protein